MPTSTLIQAEIGKFRFLNELMKLVSPKYLGNCTSSVIKSRITSLLKGWSDRYPQETKIKEAFDMLIKQGVVMVILLVKCSHVPEMLNYLLEYYLFLGRYWKMGP